MPTLPEAPRRRLAPLTPYQREMQQIVDQGHGARARLRQERLLVHEERAQRNLERADEMRRVFQGRGGDW